MTSLSLGLLSAASPCLLPLYPGFLAYLGGRADDLNAHSSMRYWLGAAVLAGVVSMMLVLGALITALSVSIGRVLAIVIPISDGVIILLGLLLLLNRNPFKYLPQARVPALKHPLANAYVYGLLYGPLTLPCSGPLVVSIFALSFSLTDALGQLLVFLIYGLGFGLPLLVLSFLAGATQRTIT
ncbi:MAG TPA: cytochrome c biogenesis protein CcdA, partial [Anaerolineae bacterium]